MSPDETAQALARLTQEIHELREEIRGVIGKQLLTIPEAALLLKTSQNALRQQIRRGKIKAERVMGNRLRIRRQDLPPL